MRDRYHTDPEYRKKVQKDTKKRRKEEPALWRKYRKKWLDKTSAYKTYHNAYRRAKELNLPFDIKSSDIIIPEVCPILGIKLKAGGGAGSIDAPSLDRIIPEKGYVKNNIRVISMKANRLKSDGTAEEHRKIADYIDGLL